VAEHAGVSKAHYSK